MHVESFNINDYSSDLTREVANLIPLARDGKLIGRRIVHILSEDKEIDVTGVKTPEELAKRIFEASFSSIKDPKISFDQTSTFNDESFGSLEEIKSRIEAYQAIIDYLNSKKNKTSLNERIEEVLENQQKFLFTLSEQGRSSEIVEQQNNPELISVGKEEVEVHLKNLQYLQEDFLELASKILEQGGSLELLEPETKANCYSFWSSREELFSLHEKLSNYHGSEKEILNTLMQAMQKIQEAPFLKQYEIFHQLKGELENKIAAESSLQVELYLKLLIRNQDAIKKVMDQHPPEHVMGNFLSEEVKLCFYCLVKYQDEIQELAKRMGQDSLFILGIKLQDLTELSKLSEKTLSLKKHTAEIVNLAISSACETHSLSKAQNCFSEAELLIASSKNDPEAMTSIQELLWKSALGFLQNGRPEEARKSLALAARHLPSLASLGFADLDNRLKKEPQFGIHFFSLGTSYNKDQSIHLTQCLIDNKPMMKMDFFLNGHANLGLKAIRKTFDFPDTEKLMQILPDKFCSKVTVTERESHHYPEYSHGSFTSEASKGYKMPGTPQTVIEFEGVGKVIIGNCPGVKCIDSLVLVEADLAGSAEQTLPNIQTMLTALGIPPVLVETRKVDRQRKAILEVFRAFYPREAALIERDGNSFEEEPENLKKKILTIKPEMKGIFESHLDSDLLSKKIVVLANGKPTTFVNLSSEMRKKGALGLMSGIEGSVEAKAPLLSILLKSKENCGRGMISSQARFINGIIAIGQSSYSDHKEGGASGVFTRLITKEIAESKDIKEIAFHGSIQILFNLDAVNTPTTYGFEHDCYGTRSSGNYFSRLSMIELTEALQRSSKEIFDKPVGLKKYGTANEVIIRDSIGPEMIQGIVVSSEEAKQFIIKQLKSDGILENKEGGWFIRNTPIDKFIKVSGKFREEMWHD